MAKPKVELVLIKEEGKLIGFSLVADAQTEAEYFCAKMPKALANKTADIRIRGTKVTFVHPEEGECSFQVEKVDAADLRKFITRKGPYKNAVYALNRDGFLSEGFKPTLKGKEDAGERSEPIHIRTALTVRPDFQRRSR